VASRRGEGDILQKGVPQSRDSKKGGGFLQKGAKLAKVAKGDEEGKGMQVEGY
jgi:hypothetical protein